jgi:hypothetical protein
MLWPQRSRREAAQDLVTGATAATEEPPARHPASRVVDGVVWATGRRPSTRPTGDAAVDPEWYRQLAVVLGGLSVVLVVALCG